VLFNRNYGDETMNDEMGGACRLNGGDKNHIQNVSQEIGKKLN
jgi:hypothetical protein